MALIPHKITALAESDAQGTDGKNIVAGAVVSLFDENNNAVTLFDNDAGANGSTTKTTDATGQVVVYVTPGEYEEQVNGGTRRKVSIFGNSTANYATAAELAATRPTQTGQMAVNRERANAQYVLAASGYTAQTGDITAANGRVWKLVTLENFRHYGNIQDNIDCGELIEDVLNSGRSNKYKFEGNFRVDTPAYITNISNITLDCYGSYFDCSNMYGADVGGTPDGLFNFNGSRYGTTTITTDIAKGGRSFTVADGSQIKVGSNFYMLSDGELWYTENATSVTRRFIGTISSVSGNTVTINEYIPYSFDCTSHTVTIESWSQVENITVLGGEFFGGFYRRNIANGQGIGFFTSQFYKNIIIKDCSIKGFENISIWTKFGSSLTVKDCYIQGHEADYPLPVEGVDSGFYGVFFNTSRTFLMENVTGFRTRHLQDAAHAFDTKIVNCTSIESHRGAFGCHQGTYDGYYSGCTAFGRNAGVQWRGMNLHVDGCRFESYVAGTTVYDSIGSTSDLLSYRKITNCNLYSARDSVRFDGGNVDITIQGCEITTDDASYNAVRINNNVNSLNISNNTRIENLNGGVAIALYAETISLFKIDNNYIKSDTNLIRVFSPLNTARLFITNNVFDSTGLFDLNIVNSQIVEVFRDNTKLDGTAATRTA